MLPLLLPLLPQVRLVIEFCDRGSLRDALNRGAFVTRAGRVNMLWVVESALEVGRAMLHLHSENIIHGDLKVGVHTECSCDGSVIWRRSVMAV